jgi:rubredoxin
MNDAAVGADLKKWVCLICGFIYEEAKGLPDHGIAPGTRFATLPEDWTCPECGSPKSSFEPYQE